MNLESTTYRTTFNSRSVRPVQPGVFFVPAAVRTVFLVDAADSMMTPIERGGAAPYLTALRGIGAFTKVRPQADIDIQSVNAVGLRGASPADDGGKVSHFEQGALARGIADVTQQGASRLVIVTDRDPKDLDGVCIAARRHLASDVRNSVDFLVVSPQWGAFNLGARLSGIGTDVSLKTAASVPDVTRQLNGLFGNAPAAGAPAARR